MVGAAALGLVAAGATSVLIQGGGATIATLPPMADDRAPMMARPIASMSPMVPMQVALGVPPPLPGPFVLRLADPGPADPVPAVAGAAPPPPTWSAVFEAGDTLDTLLSRAGIDAVLRAEIALALGVEYDLRRLKPGHSLAVRWTPGGAPAGVSLAVEDGVRVEIDLDGPLTAETLVAEPIRREAAGQIVIGGSIYASLDRAGLPVRFAVDLAQVLGDTVDLRRDLQGGESLRLMWSETVTADGAEIGAPRLSYAALDLGKTRYEIVWSDEEPGRAGLFRDGEAVRTVAPPVVGARLSSVFGRRRHPVYGDMRMHTGVDYAARRGAPVSATAPGRIAFVGRRGGYGRVVELSHGRGTMTRYAHLSAVPDGLSVGDRVGAGDLIGRVGATGTATGPNLHYEVRVDGRPIDPLVEEAFPSVETIDLAGAALRLREERLRFLAVAGMDG